MGEGDETIRISAAGLLVTYWCNARCAHCYELSGPRRQGWMSADAALGHFQAMVRLGMEPAGVHLGGGEPFGDFGRLVEIVRAARQAGLAGVGYVETNGYWATDEALVRERLGALREAGMRQLSLSADVYHQTFVDPQCVVRLWRVATEVLGTEGVRARRWRFLKSPQDLREASEAQRQAAYREALAQHAERMTGRAATELAPLVARQPAEAVRGQTCVEGLRDSAHVHIDPAGYVFPGTCAGLILGRTDRGRPLDAVLAASRGPMWRILVSEGPWGLRSLAARKGYKDDPGGYADKCHLCLSARRFLLETGAYADELGPPELYREEWFPIGSRRP
ncbi:MAG TPA: radical SAM protein [Phycisphaerae bacterium]|nr:radical SAM protein [Phycisphaerae bacterium]